MISSWAGLPDLVIASGQSISNVYQGVYTIHDAIGLMVYSPADLPEGVYFEVNPNQVATNASSGWQEYETFDVNGNSIQLFVPTEGKSQIYQEPIFGGSVRLHSDTPVAGDRVFKVTKQWTT